MIPKETLETLQRYIDRGLPPGGFLEAVLENNLVDAVVRADSKNREAIPAIVEHIWNKAPARCWANRERVDRWIGHRGLNGLIESPPCPINGGAQ